MSRPALLDPELWSRFRDACRPSGDKNDLDAFDPDLVQRLAPPFAELLEGYYRMEVEGLARVPRTPALLVGNHNSGITFLDGVAFFAHWYRVRGVEERLYGLGHDVIMALPYVGHFLHRGGTVQANQANALAAFARGHKVVVFPGGMDEAFRTYRERHRIRFGQHAGFVRLALRARVPIVPLVTIGGHEGFLVLHADQRLPRLLRLDRLLRITTLPITLSVPWGLTVGPWFYLPLPTKVIWRCLEPITLDEYEPAAADDPELVQQIRQLVVDRMQQALDDLAQQRRWPVVG